MDFVEDFARQWEIREREDIFTLFERVKTVIHNRSMNTRAKSIFKNPNVAKHLD